MGGGESLRILHEVLNKNKLLKGAWQLSPYFENLLLFSLHPENKPSMKIIYGFRGIIFELAVRLKTHR